MRHHLLLVAALAYLATANLIWIARDTRPPFWDMASHQTRALAVLDEIAANGLAGAGRIPEITGTYPPFYHAIVAAFYAVFGCSADAAQWANLPALAIILFATFGIARRLLPPLPAAMSGVIAVSYPYMLWLSRETVIDYWLTAMVAAAIWLLLKTDGFSDRRWSALFGIAAGLGMLTKPMFAVFVALPALWFARRQWTNALLAAGIALALASYWYAGQFQDLVRYWYITADYGEFEGDPATLTLQGVLFYIRAFEGYQAFLPLFLLFAAGAIALLRRPDPAWMPILLWILGGWGSLLLIQNKDPRFSVALLPAAAIVSAAVFVKRERWIGAALALLLFQHYLVSFGIRSMPEAVALARGFDGGQVVWNWNLYTQTYFGFWGPPRKEDWGIERVLDRAAQEQDGPVRLGLIPDIPRFDAMAFEFHILRGRRPIVVERIAVFNDAHILDQDFVLLSENGQGYFEYASDEWGVINDYVYGNPGIFQLVEWFPLPSGEIIRLYKVAVP